MAEVKGKNKGKEYYDQLHYSILLHEAEDEGEKYWIAEIPELPGCKSHGLTPDEAISSVSEAKRDWVSDSLAHDEEVPEPIDRNRFNGKVLVRMSRSLHRSLGLLASSENLSTNQLIVTILAKEVGRLGVLNRVEKKLDKVLDGLEETNASGAGQRWTLAEPFGWIYSRSVVGGQLFAVNSPVSDELTDSYERAASACMRNRMVSLKYGVEDTVPLTPRTTAEEGVKS